MPRMYFQITSQMVKQLRLLDTWLQKAAEYAKSRSFDPGNLAGIRLAPDQFALDRQVLTACDTLKLGMSRVTGLDVPSVPDTEKTIDELRARVQSTVEIVSKATAKDFEGTATRVVTTPRWEGKTMTGSDYFVEHVVPNFYFHLTHCYAILRHAGVPLGKRDYLGSLTQKLPA